MQTVILFLVLILLSLMGVYSLNTSQFGQHLSDYEAASAVKYLAIVLLLLAGLTHRKIKLSFALKSLFLWSLVFTVGLCIYSYRYALLNSYETLRIHVMPGTFIDNQDRSMTFAAGDQGHFYINMHVNDTPVTFLLDTGATSIILTQEDAQRIGLNPSNLSYNSPSYTANGKTMLASTKVKTMRVGELSMHEVSVSVSQDQLNISLLGMRFLKNLKRYEFEDGMLRIWY